MLLILQEEEEMGSLDGLKVLDFSTLLPGPYATLMLADMGAEVLKVSSASKPDIVLDYPPFIGDTGISACQAWLGRNKKTMFLNLKTEEGKAIVKELVKEYDIVLEQFRLGVMDKLGLGYEELKKINPRIIYCSCSGYGSSGPYVNKPGQDLLIQGMSGLAALTGASEEIPSPVGTPVVDQHGAILAALGIIASLYDRERTGKGHKIEASLLSAALDLQQEALGYYMNGGRFTERPHTGLSTRLHSSPYGIYRTQNGHITLGMTPVEKLKEIFTPRCMDGYTAEDQMNRRIEFDRIVSEEMKKRTTEEWMELFESLGIWYAPVNEYDAVLEDEQVKYNRNILTMHHPEAGDVRVVGHANKYDGKNIGIRKLPPKLGESTCEILKRLPDSVS